MVLIACMFWVGMKLSAPIWYFGLLMFSVVYKTWRTYQSLKALYMEINEIEEK